MVVVVSNNVQRLTTSSLAEQGNPVRDLMLVENAYFRKHEHAVRYAISLNTSRPCGTSRSTGGTLFYPHFVPNGTMTSFLPNLNNKTTSLPQCFN